MTATQLIKSALEMGQGMVLKSASSLRDEPLAAPTPNGGNHAMWIVGHLAWGQGHLRNIMLGEVNPLDHWKPLFAAGSEPVSDPKHYPSFDEVLEHFKQRSDTNLQWLATLTDVDLDTPSTNIPEGFEHFFGTYGQCLMLSSLDEMHHHGQLADVRRALGRKRTMA